MSDELKMKAAQEGFCYHPDLAGPGEWLEMADKFLAAMWQPIETAPKDGTWILLTGGKTGDWSECAQRPVVAKWGAPSGAYYCEGTNWHVAYWDDDWRTWYEEPTHWMPIPVAP